MILFNIQLFADSIKSTRSDSADSIYDYYNYSTTSTAGTTYWGGNSNSEIYGYSSTSTAGTTYTGGSSSSGIYGYSSTSTAGSTYMGSDGDDNISVYKSNSTVNGGKGNDTIQNSNNATGIVYEYNSGDGDDVIIGFTSKDSLIVDGVLQQVESQGTGDIVITVGSGSIVIKNYSAIIDNTTINTIVTGTAYADSITNSASNVTINALGGNDTIRNYSNANTAVDGGDGDDIIYGYSSTYTSNATYLGGDGNDSIQIFTSNSKVDGGAGNDTIRTSGSNVTISGGVDDDFISLGSYYNSYVIEIDGGNVIEYSNGDGNDTVKGFSSYDTIIINGTSYSQYISDNNLVINAGNGSITLLDAASSNPTILNPSTGSVVQNENSYTYYGGDGVIDNYTEGEQINIASDFTGIWLDDNNFYFNSSSGSLMIQNARDKIIGYGTADGNLVAYSYMASYGGDIDFRDVPQFEVIIGASNQNNQIYAGSGGSSMWGGIGGNDTLVGGDGYDEFFFAQGCGGDVIQNAGDNDIVNLLGVTFDQITAANVSEFAVNVTFADGSYLNVEGNSNVGYQLEGKVYTCNNSTGEWYEK